MMIGILYTNTHNERMIMYITFVRPNRDTIKLDNTTTTKNIAV